MKRIFIVFFLALFASCHPGNGVDHQSDTIVSPPSQATLLAAPLVPQSIENNFDSIVKTRFPWMRDTILSYILLSENEMVKDYVTDSSIMFIYDQMRNTDTAGYMIVHLGADVNNGDGVVFATAGWLYIDTLSRKIYELDIPNDVIHPWVRP